MLAATLTGLVTGLSLIVAIGAQNAFVLRQGLARQHVGIVVAICAVADVVLIVAGVAGIGQDRRAGAGGAGRRAVARGRVPDVVRRVVAAAGLARRSPRGTEGAGADPARAAVRATALTFLNPHVYLDTVLLLGSLAAHQGPTGRWWFALGACVASVAWFTGSATAPGCSAPC